MREIQRQLYQLTGHTSRLSVKAGHVYEHGGGRSVMLYAT